MDEKHVKEVTRFRSGGVALILGVAIMFLLGACVSKQRYQDEVSRREMLEKQLAEEEGRRATLEEDIAVLKDHIDALRSESGDKNRSSEKKRAGIRKGLRALEEALGLAGEMGGEIEKGLRGNLQDLKEKYEETLEETKTEIAKFQDRLENDEDLRRLRREIRKQIEALRSLIEEIDAGPGKG